mmetsp:Transcript_72244/g.159521  ORF Transcript_72244/g.159521 Transcript_72244/m.159521 type:complete len:96 (+) Transcript_72244:148-435(+)
MHHRILPPFYGESVDIDCERSKSVPVGEDGEKSWSGESGQSLSVTVGNLSGPARPSSGSRSKVDPKVKDDIKLPSLRSFRVGEPKLPGGEKAFRA